MSSVLEDVEAIKKLKFQYAEACDELFKSIHNVVPFSKVFTKDIVWDGAAFGRHEGCKQVKKFFEGVATQFTFSVYFFTNPSIKVEGDKARGRWYLLAMFTQPGGRDMLLAGIEDDKYEKVNGQWLMTDMKLTPILFAPHDEGWYKKW